MAKREVANGVSSAPRGMARVGSKANAPWWHLKNGNAVYAKLLSIHERPDERAKAGKSKFFQVELVEYVDEQGVVHPYYYDPKTKQERPTEVRVGRGKGAKFVPAKPGDIINLNYGPKTKDFEPFMQDIMRGGEYVVLCLIEGDKFEIKNSQTMWPIETWATQTRAPRPLEDPDFEDDDDGEESQAGAGAGAA